MSDGDRISSSSGSAHTYPESTSSDHYSRSSQQVPQIFENVNGHNVETAYQCNNFSPFLEITEQPSDTFRFRYISEMVGTHGCLLGEKSKKGREKSYPGVELCNYIGRAIIRCSLAQVNGDKSLHPHRLMVNDQEEEVVQEVDARMGYRVVFSGMGIIHTAKKNVAKELYLRKETQLKNELENWNKDYEIRLKKECEEKAKSINLNQVCLCFTAHRIEDGTQICPPVYTVAINNLKSALTNELKIVRISKVKGKCKGGDDVFIFVEKVTKKNIKVRFFELEDDTRLWEAYATFSYSDVHHQHGIVFQTPPYRDVRLSNSKDVWVELVRPSDGKVSEPVKFTYQADPSAAYAPGKRRRAEVSTSFSSLASSGTSVNSLDTTVRAVLKSTQPVPEEAMGINALMSNIASANEMNSHKEMLGDALMQKYDTSALLSSPAFLQKMDVGSVDVGAGADDVAMSSVVLNSELLQDGADSEEYRNFFRDYSDSYMGLLPTDSGVLRMDGVGIQKVDQKAGQSKDKSSPSKDPSSVTYNKEEHICKSLEPEVKMEAESCSDEEGEYTATYNAADGERMQRLISELQGLLNSPCHKSSVSTKLEELMDIKLSNGDAFLHMTIQKNVLDTVTFMVQLLVELNLTDKMNIQNRHGDTVLHTAVLCDRPTIIPILVQAGCNPNIEDSEGNTPLHHAISYARKECFDKLLAADRTNSIPEHKINFNAINSDGHCPLHLCAVAGPVSGAAALLGRGADVNVVDPAGRTALHLATKAALKDEAEISEAYKVIVILLQSKADIDAVDNDGNTALRTACRDSKARDIIKLLLEKGADPMKALLITDNVDQDEQDDEDDEDVSQERILTADYTRTLVDVLNDIGKVEMANMVFEKYLKG